MSATPLNQVPDVGAVLGDDTVTLTIHGDRYELSAYHARALSKYLQQKADEAEMRR